MMSLRLSVPPQPLKSKPVIPRVSATKLSQISSFSYSFLSILSFLFFSFPFFCYSSLDAFLLWATTHIPDLSFVVAPRVCLRLDRRHSADTCGLSVGLHHPSVPQIPSPSWYYGVVPPAPQHCSRVAPLPYYNSWFPPSDLHLPTLPPEPPRSTPHLPQLLLKPCCEYSFHRHPQIGRKT